MSFLRFKWQSWQTEIIHVVLFKPPFVDRITHYMITCCLLLSTILQVRKAVDPWEETEMGGTMMIGQAIGLTPRLTTNPRNSSSNPANISRVRSGSMWIGMRTRSSSSLHSLCSLWWSLSPPCGDNRLLHIWAHWSRVSWDADCHTSQCMKLA